MYKLLARTSEWKKPLGWENNIRVDLSETGRGYGLD